MSGDYDGSVGVVMEIADERALVDFDLGADVWLPVVVLVKEYQDVA